MKRKIQKKLVLNKETLRMLSGPTLRFAAGGFGESKALCNTSNCTEGCHTTECTQECTQLCTQNTNCC